MKLHFSKMDFNSNLSMHNDNNGQTIQNGGLKRKMDLDSSNYASMDDDSNSASVIKKHIALNIIKRQTGSDVSPIGIPYSLDQTFNCGESMYNYDYSSSSFDALSNGKFNSERDISHILSNSLKTPKMDLIHPIKKEEDYNEPNITNNNNRSLTSSDFENFATDTDFFNNDSNFLDSDIKEEIFSYSKKQPSGEKQPTYFNIVEKRKIASTKEKRRLERMNDAFKCLRTCIPISLFEKSDRRPSKVQTLRLATYYIKLLSELLDITSKLSDDELYSQYCNEMIESINKVEKLTEIDDTVIIEENIEPSKIEEDSPPIPDSQTSIESTCLKSEEPQVTIVDNKCNNLDSNTKDIIVHAQSFESLKDCKSKDEIIPSKILLDTDGIQRIIMEMYEPGSKHIPSFTKHIGDTVPEYLLEYICTCQRCENQCTLVSKYNCVGTGNVATYIIL